jgi:hypothetical protein
MADENVYSYKYMNVQMMLFRRSKSVNRELRENVTLSRANVEKLYNLVSRIPFEELHRFDPGATDSSRLDQAIHDAILFRRHSQRLSCVITFPATDFKN